MKIWLLSYQLHSIGFSLIIYIMFLINKNTSSVDISLNSNNCSEQENCKNCGPEGCVKCSDFIIYQSRKCVPDCPSGYISQWSTFIDYMGKICLPSKLSTKFHVKTFAMISKTDAVFVLAITLFLLILLSILIIGLIIRQLIQKRRNNLLREKHELMLNKTDTKELQDFLEQLDLLRPYANFYLELLNITRYKIRQFFNNGDNIATTTYKPIARDLGRILFLLNYPNNEMISIPDDWNRLHQWAQMLQDKVTKNNYNSDDHDVFETLNFSTFKPDNCSQSRCITNGNSSTKNILGPQLSIDSSIFGSIYCLTDDFSCLGKRPQDHITTEL